MFGYKHLLYNLGPSFLIISSVIYFTGGGVGADVTKMIIYEKKKGKKNLFNANTSITWTKMNDNKNFHQVKNLLRFKNLEGITRVQNLQRPQNITNNCLVGKSLLGKITFINVFSHFGQYLETI